MDETNEDTVMVIFFSLIWQMMLNTMCISTRTRKKQNMKNLVRHWVGSLSNSPFLQNWYVFGFDSHMENNLLSSVKKTWKRWRDVAILYLMMIFYPINPTKANFCILTWHYGNGLMMRWVLLTHKMNLHKCIFIRWRKHWNWCPVIMDCSSSLNIWPR